MAKGQQATKMIFIDQGGMCQPIPIKQDIICESLFSRPIYLFINAIMLDINHFFVVGL